jgi:energy-coupling factor transporter ATP-binding protein EcfA2
VNALPPTTHRHGPHVIAVAGPPGSGKSTLVAAIAHALGEAAVLSMDDYQQMTALPIGEIVRWMARGADHDELPVPWLGEHLAALKRGHPVTVPGTGATVQPRPHIVLETHFGRAHRATGQFIDWLVWLDTPPDIALARNLRHFIAPLLQPPAAAEVAALAAGVTGYLDNYVEVVAGLVHLQRERVRPAADQCVDGTAAPALLAQQVCSRWRAARR